MKQVPFAGPTNIRCHLTKFSRHGGLAPGICASLLHINVTFGNETLKIQCLLRISDRQQTIKFRPKNRDMEARI
jgi:hypothetical protein